MGEYLHSSIHLALKLFIIRATHFLLKRKKGISSGQALNTLKKNITPFIIAADQ